MMLSRDWKQEMGGFDKQERLIESSVQSWFQTWLLGEETGMFLQFIQAMNISDYLIKGYCTAIRCEE